MSTKYNHKQVESKWQKVWKEKKLYKTKESGDKPKYYVLDMFPYPSGAGLHVGHPKGYIATDIVARMKMMRGFNVLHPMGWDAFGLPAENYALKNKIHPAVATKKNIQVFKKQLGLLGFTYDWDREVNTTDPRYYKWTQWIFLQMFKRGLAYESYEPINWCPSCKTGLANEDLEDGKCERCGSVVEQKPMRQWVLKITDYAERLLKDLDLLDKWPEPIKEMQRNWIGKSDGALVRFPLLVKERGRGEVVIEVFTTRPDTLFGATYVVLAPEHSIIEKLKSKIKNFDEVNKYIQKAKNKTVLERTELQKEKTGVELKDIKAINPVNNEELPIFVADYVLGNYGTGAIMAVPAHDERDFEFAKKYGLSILEVVIPKVVDKHDPPKDGVKTVFRNAIQAIVINPKNNKVLCLHWKKFPWTTFVTGGINDNEDRIESAKREILEETGYKNLKFTRQLGGPAESHFYASHKGENRKAHFWALVFELENEERDGVSAKEQGIHDVVWMTWDEMKEDKNIKCAEYDIWLDRFFNHEHAFVDDGVAINSSFLNDLSTTEAKEKIIQWLEEKGAGKRKIQYKLRDWVFSRQRYWGEPIPLVRCERCGWIPIPEKDLPLELPKVKHYEPSGTGESPLAKIEKWVNTKCPQCNGPAKRETNTMPQWAGSCWYYLRYEDPNNKKALVDKIKEKYWSPIDLYVGGAEHATRHLIYARFWHKFLYDIGAVGNIEPFTKLQNVGLILAEDGRKMSKRWNNVINPDDVVKQYGADAMRLYEMFMGPFDQPCAWSTQGVVGMKRFLERVWNLKGEVVRYKLHDTNNIQYPISNIQVILNQTIKKVTEDIEALRFNTAISHLMILTNEMSRSDVLSPTSYAILLQLLAPFAPHICEELWATLGNKKSIFLSDWPKYEASKLQFDIMKLAVQVNGKVRAEIEVATGAVEEEIKSVALADENVKKWLDGKAPKKVIYVKGRLISVVV